MDNHQSILDNKPLPKHKSKSEHANELAQAVINKAEEKHLYKSDSVAVKFESEMNALSLLFTLQRRERAVKFQMEETRQESRERRVVRSVRCSWASNCFYVLLEAMGRRSCERHFPSFLLRVAFVSVPTCDDVHRNLTHYTCFLHSGKVPIPFLRYCIKCLMLKKLIIWRINNVILASILFVNLLDWRMEL